MTNLELKEILDKHLKWLRGEEGGERADLHGAILCNADLHGEDLRSADLRDAKLCDANLYNAKLYFADLRGADLRGANLSNANLYCAKLHHVDLRDAEMCGANLRGARWRGADVYGANLCDAKIDTELLDYFFPICCPEYGSFVAWKKAGGFIVKLEVTENAKRSSAYGRKCRCSEAKVLAIETLDGKPSEVAQVSSGHDENFIYTIGEIVKVENFDENRWSECAPGIHFFITRREAVNYL